MTKYLRYFSYLLRHKFYVAQECFRLGIPLLGLWHDASKFRPAELIPYTNFFYGKDFQARTAGKRDTTGYYKPTDTGDAAFDFAWLLHQKRNKHHWQWWTLVLDNPDEASTGIIYGKMCVCGHTHIAPAQSSVNAVVLSARSLTSRIQPDNTAFSVQNTGQSIAPNSVPSDGSFNETTIESGIQETPRLLENERDLRAPAGEIVSFDITAEAHQSAPAAENNVKSSSASTISKVEEQSTELQLKATAIPCTGGLSTTDSPQSFGCSATIAIPPSATMDIAPTTCPNNPGVKVLDMPLKYRREMLADWRGAGKAQGKPDTLAWYGANRTKMQLHPDTRAWIEAQLEYRQPVICGIGQSVGTAARPEIRIEGQR